MSTVFHTVAVDKLTDEVRTRRRLPSPPERLRIRREASVSQARLAAEIGVTRAAVSRWEAGKRVPRGANLIAYVKLLDELRELGA